MQVRWLGWAGVELEAAGETVVIDPLEDPGATFAAFGDAAADVPLPAVTRARRGAVAGLLSHLHRDHADAGALVAALDESAPVLAPPMPAAAGTANLALAQADAELQRTALTRRPVEAGERLEAGPFALTALPAVDGLGDPQVSWLVEAGGRRALHLGDTMFHSFWWRMAAAHGPFDVVFAPINGPVVDFPHLQPPSGLPAALEPEQAALAAELLGAATVVPIHFGGYDAAPWYRPTVDAAERFAAAAAGRPYDVRLLEPGEGFELEAPAAAI